METNEIVITDDVLKKIGFECIDKAAPVGKFKDWLEEYQLRTTWQTVVVWKRTLPNKRVIYRLDGLNSEYNRAEIITTLDLINGIILFHYNMDVYNHIVDKIRQIKS